MPYQASFTLQRQPHTDAPALPFDEAKAAAVEAFARCVPPGQWA